MRRIGNAHPGALCSPEILLYSNRSSLPDRELAAGSILLQAGPVPEDSIDRRTLARLLACEENLKAITRPFRLPGIHVRGA